MNIEWKEINPNYIVSSDGQVGSRWSGKLKMLKPGRNSNGYMLVVLCDGSGGKRSVTVHILVAEAFLGPRPTPKHQVNHKNGVKIDNRDHNLEWVTYSQNTRHSYDVLGNKAAHGEAHSQVKLTEAEVREIRRRQSEGELQRVIAADHGITPSNVSQIANGKRWSWLV